MLYWVSFMKRLARKIRKHRHFEYGALVVSLGIIGAGTTLLWVSALPLPDFASFEQRKVAESTKIYDRTGKILLFDVHKDIKRTVVPLDEISRHMKNATIAIEDSEFYEHHGIKITAIVRAFFVNLLAGETIQGGSTITQQAIKNTLLSNERRLTRKIKEAVLAIKLERVLSKDEILEIYLNETPYGGNIYGVEEASLAFFGKRAKDLGLAESAYLAGLTKAPTYYSPYGEHRDKLEERKDVVFDRMAELGFITEEEALAGKGEEVLFAPRQELSIKAPHFVIYVREHLEKLYGPDVDSLGLRVTTTLDWEIQQKAEEIAQAYATENKKNFNAENVGIVIIDPRTGHILGMVGSRNYFDEEIDGNFNIATALRQPGSAIKPFVYATAFKEGYTPQTTIFDLETQFSTACDADGNPIGNATEKDCYKPVNYDSVFRGPISMKNALAQSINIPAVKTLYLAGPADSIKSMKDAGITSLNDVNRYGLTLVLGGGEVSLLELTSAYGVFAANGLRATPEKIVSVADQSGKPLYESRVQSKQVLDEEVVKEINDILSDDDARAPAFGHNSPLSVPGYSVASKTGTTNDYRDAWIVGYSPRVVVGAWAGNNDNTPMDKKVAGFIVAPMWNTLMREILPGFGDELFQEPEGEDLSVVKPAIAGLWRGGQEYFIDTISGKLATEHTPIETKERRVLTQVHSILYWINKDDPRGSIPANPERDHQFNLWETSVRRWAILNGFIDEGNEKIPSEVDDIHTKESVPRVSFVSPQSGATLDAHTRTTFTVNVSTQYQPNQVDFFLNDTYIGTSRGAPYSISLVPNEIGAIQGENKITVRAYDSVRNKKEETIFVNVAI